MRLIQHHVPAHIAPLFVQIPRWNGRLNVYRGRPDEPPHNPLGEDVVYSAIYSARHARNPKPPLVLGFHWNHEIEPS